MISITPIRITIILAALVLFSCINSDSNSEKTQSQAQEISDTLEYAVNFEIVKLKKGILLKNLRPWEGNSSPFHYLLVDSSIHIPENKPGADTIYIRVPVQRVVCLSTTHVGYLSALMSDTAIVGLSGPEWIHNPKVQRRFAEGKIKDVGRNMTYDYEAIIDLKPDIILAFGVNQKSAEYIQKLTGYGIEVVVLSEFMEQHPLGKAEWIKFVGALVGKSKEAERFFSKVSNEYLNLSKRAIQEENKPTVLTGLPWKGDWFVPGGASFQAKLLEDAGANYLWSENDQTSGMVVDIESVIDKALEAEYWINLNDYEYKHEVQSLDERYRNFTAFQKNQLFNNNARKNAAGGNDYWESGVVRPDLILKDLTHIFHPELVENHQLFYYQRLN